MGRGGVCVAGCEALKYAVRSGCELCLWQGNAERGGAGFDCGSVDWGEAVVGEAGGREVGFLLMLRMGVDRIPKTVVVFRKKIILKTDASR